MNMYRSITCALFSLLAAQAAYAVETKECTLEFKLNSAVILENQAALDECLNQVDPKSVSSVTIIGSATLSGPAKRNKVLSHERSVTMESIVKAKFPDIVVQRVSVGENKQRGKTSKLTFILKDPGLEQSKQQLLELQQKNESLQSELQEKEQREQAARDAERDQKLAAEKNKPFSEGNPNFRIAARFGVDNTRSSAAAQRSFASIGAEAAWVNRDSSFRPELGAKINTSVNGVKIGNDSVANVTNSYGFVGIGSTALGFVTGLRGLVGYEWINIGTKLPEDNRFAVGGEARIGYEWKRGPSVFASYGLTERLQMIGLDIGVSL